jgi:hypothetical protein
LGNCGGIEEEVVMRVSSASNRRTFLAGLVRSLAAAQDYPYAASEDHRAVRGRRYPPTSTRVSSAQRLQDTMGQPFVVDNRPAPARSSAPTIVPKSPAGRLHAAVMSNTHTVNESLIPNVRIS